LAAIIGFFLPVHLLFKPIHRCMECGAGFTSSPGWPDFILMSLFGMAIAMSREFWWFGAIMLFVWVLFAGEPRLHRRSSAADHVLLAGMFLAMLWLAVFLTRIDVASSLMTNYGGLIFGGAVGFGFCFGVFLQYLECVKPPHLTPLEQTSSLVNKDTDHLVN